MAERDDSYKSEADRILAENLPSSQSAEGFIACHEMFQSLQEAGFTHYEALWLMGYFISNGSGKDLGDGD